MADIEFDADLYVNKKHNTEYFAFDKLEIGTPRYLPRETCAV